MTCKLGAEFGGTHRFLADRKPGFCFCVPELVGRIELVAYSSVVCNVTQDTCIISWEGLRHNSLLQQRLTAQIPLDFNNPKPWVLSRHIENLVSRIEGEPDKKAQKTRHKNDIGDCHCNGLGPQPRSDQRADEDNHLHMSFAELQRMRLRELQCRLVKSIVDMRIDPRTAADWEANLKEYIQAVRDYDFMTECSQRNKGDNIRKREI
ncbi:hypothetical protein N657DRAFT_674850 [Parathielavia appendiculata]|uniref:Uncharacterized protein n=1 Tax=Parathielavia appendiculata TaxID=2587402 RepID=A0AAN6Z0G0_9PEZI|nr:hypothetical protein N657DRAFT_674850 [Parathielavia appendiculata]